MYETLIPIALGAATAISGVLWLNAKAQLRTMTQARDDLSQDLAGVLRNFEAAVRQGDKLRDEIVTKRAEIKTLTSKLTQAEGRAAAAEMELDALKSKPLAKVKAPKAPAAKVKSAAAPKPAAKRPAKAKA